MRFRESIRFQLLLIFTGFVGQAGTAQEAAPGSEVPHEPFQYHAGAIIRGDQEEKCIALVFTGDEYADGGAHIHSILHELRVPAAFFLTGNFYRNPEFDSLVLALKADGHYLGAHSDRHLLYCDWVHRDSLLVGRSEFESDLEGNYRAMSRFGIRKQDAPYFLPPYEWYNDSISAWTRSMGLILINHTPGTLSHADYTLPGAPGYRSSEVIYRSIAEFEKTTPGGLNGFILLTHIGTAPERTDKFYLKLGSLIGDLKSRGYTFVELSEMLAPR